MFTLPFKPRISTILTKHTFPSHPLITTFAPALHSYKLKMVPEHVHTDQIYKPTSTYTTPPLNRKMVTCTVNKNEYRLTFITTLINNCYTICYKDNHHHSKYNNVNNWYTICYKHNHRHSQYINDTKESLQITDKKDIQEGPTNILVPFFTLPTTSSASLSNKSSKLAPPLDIVPIT